MAVRRLSRTTTTARKLGELGLAAPQVAAHRLSRMALNGPVYSVRDQREFIGMIQEKQVAFVQSWMAMFWEGVKVQQGPWRAWATAFSWWTSPRRRAPLSPDTLLRIANKGLAPVHRRAVANSRRLARTRPR
ncbi:MAG: hypothetical protein J0H00_14740 [Burkholderiales bacterium]|nr:hypothetical protein [Burkholderiales bacterium]OJX06396.1 MAG: hypothetical protein BGO72_10770 [Burkholderiales bacterium 70-64]